MENYHILIEKRVPTRIDIAESLLKAMEEPVLISFSKADLCNIALCEFFKKYRNIEKIELE